MSESCQKKIVPILLRLEPSLGERLDKASVVHHRGRQVIIRDGLTAELDRLDVAATGVSPKELKAIASYKKVTGRSDIDHVLAKEMREHVMRSAAHNQALSTGSAPSSPAAVAPADFWPLSSDLCHAHRHQGFPDSRIIQPLTCISPSSFQVSGLKSQVS